MSLLINLLVLVLIIGILVWLFQSVIPLPDPWRTIALVIIGLIAVVWLLGMIGYVDLPTAKMLR